MSHPTPQRPIPVGILVPARGNSPRAKERPQTKSAVRPLSARLRSLWLPLLVAACAVWTFGLVGVAVFQSAGAREPASPPIQIVANQGAPAVNPNAQPLVPVPDDFVIDVQIDAAQVDAPQGNVPLAIAGLQPGGGGAPPLVNLPPILKPAVPAAADQAEEQPVKAAVCAANLGTRIHFVKDPPEAFRQARQEKKLVLVIHLSGNFEEKEFT